MLRIIVRIVHMGPEGQSLPTEYRTFELDHAELESFLRSCGTYSSAGVIGAELMDRHPARKEITHG